MLQTDLSGKLAGWSLKLQEYDFCIKHQKGSENMLKKTKSYFWKEVMKMNI